MIRCFQPVKISGKCTAASASVISRGWCISGQLRASSSSSSWMRLVPAGAPPHGTSRCSMHSLTCATRQLSMPSFLGGARRGPKIVVDDSQFDKTASHFSGKFLGVPMDAIVFYSKAGAVLLCVWFVVHLFFRGYVYLTDFSLHTVARLGFMGGFVVCGALQLVAIQVKRRVQISPSAVYNQSISLAMRHPSVLEYLGPHPRTGDFRAYCASGGFKLPLLRRLRSGSYELADALGLKPRRLQMMFILRNLANGREGLVSVDVQKEQSGFLRHTDTFKSLAVTLTDTASSGEPNTIVIIGRPEDVVYRGFLKL